MNPPNHSPVDHAPASPNRDLRPEPRREPARRRNLALGSAVVLASGSAAIVAGAAGTASAATYDVTTCADTGTGSLREAILDANANPGADTITISATCTASGPVAVSSEMVVPFGADGLTIIGPGPADFVLDGGDSTRILKVASAADFSLSGVTLQHGSVVGNGGAARIATSGHVSITGVVIADNVATDAGGGLRVGSADSVTISDVTVVGNEAANVGGGLYIYNNGPVTISGSTFADNTAATGGGIYIYSQPGTVAINNSTITGNTATSLYGRGGGLHVELYYQLAITFSTITDNSAVAAGGGLYASFSVDEVTMTGTVFAGNTSGVSGTDEISSGATVVVEAHNLIQGTVDGFTPSATDVLGVDPLLGALTDNGGPTPTRALTAGSPAIDAGPASFPPFPADAYDQRGAPYVRIAGGRADIGAFEVQVDDPRPTPEPEPTFTG